MCLDHNSKKAGVVKTDFLGIRAALCDSAGDDRCHPGPISAEAFRVSSTSVPLSANKSQSSYPMGYTGMAVFTLSLECPGKSLSLQPLVASELPSSDRDDGRDRGNLPADTCGPTVC